MSKKSAYFAGGCFWCITPILKIQNGVSGVVCGFSGGDEENPTYEDVKRQLTGHRETVRVDYDPDVIRYGKLLDVFLAGVDPFDEGGQYIDRGFSYTLAVYYSDDDERAEAERKIRELEEKCCRRAFVSVEPFKSFYEAGEEHQDYYLNNPEKFEAELVGSGRKRPDKIPREV